MGVKMTKLDYDIPSQEMTPEQVNTTSDFQNTIGQINENQKMLQQMQGPNPLMSGGERLNA
jgi:hypothetical protein